jgi:WD40 repeat protein
MRQFSLTQLLMTVPLVAILLTLVKSEGCGTRYAMLGSLEFSPDGKQLLVVRYDARDSNVRGKGYKSDISRTISILDVESGSVIAIVEQTLQLGDHGPAWELFREGRKSAAFGEEIGTVLVDEFGGGPVKVHDLNAGQSCRPFTGIAQQSLNLALSRDRKVLATGYGEDVVVWDAASGNQLQRITVTASSNPFQGSPAIAISSDGKLIVTGGFTGVELWNVKAPSPAAPRGRLLFNEPAVALAFSPVDRTTAVAFGDRLSVYDVDTAHSRDLLQRHVSSIAYSLDGRKLAAAADDEAILFDVDTGRRLGMLRLDNGATSVAVSPDGGVVAVGDWNGSLTLWDPTAEGEARTIAVPGRASYSWPLPLAALFVWAGFCCVIWVRRRRHRSLHQTMADSVETPREY